MQYDVFNGDADGIFGLHQLRLAHPTESVPELVTGVKRDINLLKKIEDIKNCQISVFDVSLDKNRDSLLKMIKSGNRFVYFDHHYAGDIPESPQLQHHIELNPDVCTSLLVHQKIGKYPLWAICGAFGDNLDEKARALGNSLNLSEKQLSILKEIGELFNYNGYGATIEDLHFHPADLYREVSPYENPFEFYDATDHIEQLREGYANDMSNGASIKDSSTKPPNRIFQFPDKPWARRIAGVFSNQKAREKIDGAHAIIIENEDSTFQISVRAPLTDKRNADTLCRKFPTGGGRAASAGINHLPPSMLAEFIDTFHKTYGSP